MPAKQRQTKPKDEPPPMQIIVDESAIWALNDVSRQLGEARRDLSLKTFQVTKLQEYVAALEKQVATLTPPPEDGTNVVDITPPVT